MLHLREALHSMERVDNRNKRIPFSVVFCTANRDDWRKRKRLLVEQAALPKNDQKRAELQAQIDKLEIGGELIEFDFCTISGPPPVASEQKTTAIAAGLAVKAPNHYKNKTRNFKNLRNGEVRKSHIRLILNVLKLNPSPLLICLYR